MSQAISTELLARMWKSIASQKRTGLLQVEQFGEEGREQGVIYFEGGRAVRAQAGLYSGKAALRRINSWKHITCSFDSVSRPYPGNPSPMVAPQRRSAEPEPLVRRSHANASHTEMLPRTPLPAHLSSRNETEPMHIPRVRTPVARRSNPSASEMSGTSGAPRYSQRWSTRPIGQMPAPSVYQSGPVPTPVRPEPWPTDEPLPGLLAIFQPSSTATLRQTIQLMERYERIIFMLLDGHRTIEDITRLTHYNVIEVEQILLRLQKLGYVDRVIEPRSTRTIDEQFANFLTNSTESEQAIP